MNRLSLNIGKLSDVRKWSSERISHVVLYSLTALILQLFYNYVLSKIDHLTAQMEESAITLMDILTSLDEEKSKVNE